MVLATDRSLREDKKDAPDELSSVHFVLILMLTQAENSKKMQCLL